MNEYSYIMYLLHKVDMRFLFQFYKYNGVNKTMYLEYSSIAIHGFCWYANANYWHTYLLLCYFKVYFKKRRSFPGKEPLNGLLEKKDQDRVGFAKHRTTIANKSTEYFLLFCAEYTNLNRYNLYPRLLFGLR